MVTKKGKFRFYDTIDCPDFVGADATGINNNGDIVLNCVEQLGPNQYFWHGFLLRSGVYTRIDFPGAAPTGKPGLASGTLLRGISDSGLIVGIAIESDTSQHAYFTSDFGMTFTPFECPSDMGYVGAPTIAAMSSDGKVAGSCFHFITGPHTFVYENGTFTFINDLPATQGMVTGINRNGQIVGTFCDVNEDGSVCLTLHGFIGTPVITKK